ncbi:ketose-bisphosphate aldolase [Patescibacteria group bacterium]
MSLKEILANAIKERWALPHFNISNEGMLRGIAEAAKELKSPVMIGTSEGERKFIGDKQAVALVKIFCEEYGMPLFLNADHSKSFESAKAAIDAGYESIHVDLSALPFEENIKETKKVVEYAKSVNADISIEGEVGYLVTESSKVYKEEIKVPKESLAKPEDAKRFVEETGVDRLAPAVGTLHGISANKPNIDFKRISEIRDSVDGVALVLHGGSGSSDEQIREAIEAGISNIHFSTELRTAYTSDLREFLLDYPEVTTPYKFIKPSIEAVKEICIEKIQLFGSVNKI